MTRVMIVLLSTTIAATAAFGTGVPALATAALGAQNAHGSVVPPAHRASLASAVPRAGTKPQSVTQSLPLRIRDPGAHAAAKAAPRASQATVRNASPGTGTGSRLKVTSPTTSTIPMASHDLEQSVLGLDIEPPDTQLAAGPTQLLEMVNDMALLTDKSGGDRLVANLNTFFPLDAGFFFSDPRILYDAESGRWFTSGVGFKTSPNFASEVFVAGSTSGDASQPFVFYRIDSDSTHLCDQPKLGVNTDKVVVSCGNFSNATTFTGQLTFVLNKAEMMAGGSIHVWTFTDRLLFSAVPAISLSPTLSAYMVENDSRFQVFCTGPSSIVVTAFNGVPSAAQLVPTSANRNNTCLSMPPTAVPPNAPQPNRGAAIDTGDDRFLSAAWQNGVLWTGGNDACTPGGDSVVRSCMRLIRVESGGPAITSSFDLAFRGGDEYYPAVAQDPDADLFISFTASSPGTSGPNPPPIFPSAAFASIPTTNESSGTPDLVDVLPSGLNDYVGTRWGDYSAAVPDPVLPGNIWVTAEDSLATTPDRSWGTATTEVSEPPQVASLSPFTGPATGGQSVTITGSFFEPGATVNFGGNFATSVVVAPGGNSLTATTPSSASTGSVFVTVSNPDGKAATLLTEYGYTSPTPTGTTFFFAEGNTLSGFNETLYLFTPNASGNAHITYFTELGSTGAFFHPITAGQVTTVNVAADVGTGHANVSAIVALPGPGVAERRLNFTFGNWHGSTDKVGVTAPNNEWDFAEGSTLSAFSEYLTLQNPDPSNSANVSINYFLSQGGPVTKTVTLPAASRTTVQVFNGDTTNTTCTWSNGQALNCGVGPNFTGVSTQVLVTSGPPIVAERPFYVNGFSFGSGPIRDGHDAFGANSAAATWNFAEGTTQAGFNEYLTLQNPGSSTSSVTVTYFTNSGQTVVRTLDLPAASRTTLDVTKGNTNAGPITCVVTSGQAQACGVGVGVIGVSARVTVNSGPNIVVERPMYMFFDFGSGVVAGAHDVVGATSLGTIFGFAASQTTPGENDYLTIQNPNPNPATLTISYYDAAGGFPRTTTVVVPPTTRRTVQVFATPSTNSGSVGPGFSELGIVASSNLPVLVERPTYSSVGSQYGATDTLGFTPKPAF
jgi:hypothetical protein